MLEALRHQFGDPVGYALPVFALFIGIELVALRVLDDEQAKGYHGRDTRASLMAGLGSLVVGLVFRTAALLLYTVLWDHLAPWHLPADTWWSWVLLLLGVDFLFYWYHRFAHRVRLAWAAHQAHHSSEYFNLGTALRQKWNQWFEVLVWIPLPLLGFSPWTVYAAFSVNLIYQFFVHTEKVGRLPRWFEFVFNTPSHHRVHHGSDPEYLDRNYAGVLIVWDRLFGTFRAEGRRPTYGLTTPVGTYNVLRLQFHEYGAIWRDVRSARAWRDRVGFVLGPPGWRPDQGAVSGREPGGSVHRG
ncbi:sterol desaturase family protein [Actinokineospora pegani]|uniref:sterol desaturase family protein n=1 Tax=Actinokineospora pegani TaxID=2654637 RepID=UPI0012EA2183|nr:sterol desaturase family protein [Actinokineospora pegani]